MSSRDLEPQISSEHSEQIGNYTIARSSDGGVDIIKGDTTFSFNLTEAWDLFEFFHEEKASLYEHLRSIGRRAYPAKGFAVHSECCDYIADSLRRRGELIEEPQSGEKITKQEVVQYEHEWRIKHEEELDQREGYLIIPDF